MAQYKIIVNPENPTGITKEFTAEDTAAYNVHTQEHLDRREAFDNARKAEATAQASGNTKLLDLGLSQAEATALTGYTPPVEEE